jgi:hypothetical protein
MESWLPHSPATAQITLSSVKLCLSLSEVYCFHALWDEAVLQSFNVLYASEGYIYFIKSKHSLLLCFLRLFYVFVTGIS